MWIVRVVRMPNNGWNETNPLATKEKIVAARCNKVDFIETVTSWGNKLPADENLKEAYKSNCAGLSASLGKATASDRYVAIYPETAVPRYGGHPVFLSTNHATVLSKISSKVGELDLSEIVKCPGTEGGDAVTILFSWASYCAETVTLTANSVGLIDLYTRYGFELDESLAGPRGRPVTLYRKWQPIAATLKRSGLSDLNADDTALVNDQFGKKVTDKAEVLKYIDTLKFAMVNVRMKLSEQGGAALQRGYPRNVAWEEFHD